MLSVITLGKDRKVVDLAVKRPCTFFVVRCIIDLSGNILALFFFTVKNYSLHVPKTYRYYCNNIGNVGFTLVQLNF